jgi:hypothetical protein
LQGVGVGVGVRVTVGVGLGPEVFVGVPTPALAACAPAMSNTAPSNAAHLHEPDTHVAGDDAGPEPSDGFIAVPSSVDTGTTRLPMKGGKRLFAPKRRCEYPANGQVKIVEAQLDQVRRLLPESERRQGLQWAY